MPRCSPTDTACHLPSLKFRRRTEVSNGSVPLPAAPLTTFEAARISAPALPGDVMNADRLGKHVVLLVCQKDNQRRIAMPL